MAYIRKLPSGKYQTTVKVKGFKPVTKTFDNKMPAKRWAEETATKIRDGKYNDVTFKKKGHPYDELAERYFDEATPTKQHSSNDERYKDESVKFFVDKMGDSQNAEDIDVTRVFEYIAHLNTLKGRRGEDSTLSAKTIKNYVGFMSCVYEWADDVWEIPLHNPAKKAKAKATKTNQLKNPPSRDRRLTEGEEDLILNDSIEHFHQSPKYIPTHLIALVALDTAMRMQEIAAININGVNFKDKTYKIDFSKTDHLTGEKGRVIPLTDRIVELFKKIEPSDDGRLFPWHKDSLGQKFKRFVLDKEMCNLTFHDLRHEATSRLFELGLQIQEVALITGHRDWKSLQRYTHLKPASLSVKMRKLKKVADKAIKETEQLQSESAT